MQGVLGLHSINEFTLTHQILVVDLEDVEGTILFVEGAHKLP